jgi:dTDP-glucose 4,6-dehydratase
MNVKITIVTDKQRLRPKKSEVERLYADNQKAVKLLGWTPAYSEKEGFRRGLAETVAWFAEPSNLKMYKSGIYNL